MKTFFLLALIGTIASSAFSQITIHGKVSQQKGEPLVGARIILEGTYDGAISKADGSFSFKTSEQGEKNLLVRFMGHETQIIPITLTPEDLEINPVLKESFNELTAVTISAGAFEAGDKKKSVQLNSIDMVTIPGAQGNVTGALQFLPGTTTNGESGKLFVRGGSSKESQIYIDGSLVHTPYNASAPNTAVRSRFNPFMFDGSTFSTGGYSAEYGQALSSVLLLETKGIQEEDQLDISIMSVGLGLAGTKKWDKGAVSLSLNHTNLGPYVALFPQNIDWIKKPISNEGNINFRQKTKNGLFKFYSSYNDSRFELFRTDLDNPGEKNRFDLNNRNFYANSSWKGKWGKKWIGQINGSFSRDGDYIGMEENSFQEELTAAHLKLMLKRHLTKKIRFKFGVESLMQDYSQEYQTPGENFPLDFQEINYSAFVETNIYLTQNIVGRIGGRFEYSDYLQKTNIAPRVSVAYKIGKHSQISAAYGMFYQNPDNEYLVYTDDLEFEKTDQYMLNFQWSKKGRTLRTEAYYKNYSSLTKFTAAPFYLPEHYSSNGDGYAYGFDLFFRDKKTIRNGDYWISYSYLNTERNYLNYPQTAVPSFASKHNISVVYKHWFSKLRSMIGGSFSYASPRFYNDPNQDEFNSAKMKAYQTLNLNWSFLYRENIIFYFSATNVLGYEQEFGYEFASTPNTEGIYEKQLIQPPAKRFFILGCFITLSRSGDKNQLDKLN
jgi:hypothetical protein